jgi:glycine/D-amino acid oxidase-like deaminating enzyme
MERTADAIIIGAGVMGTSTAFQLVQRGVKRVVVLEKSTVAAGSSGKSSALVRMHYTFLPEARLALASLAWFQEWSERVGGAVWIHHHGVYPAGRSSKNRHAPAQCGALAADWGKDLAAWGR